MTTRFDVFPDAELLAVKILTAAGFTNVGTKLPHHPDFDAGVIQVQRVGGVPVERHRLDRARMQLDVWASTKETARLLAAEARAALMEAEGQTFSDPPATLTGVDDDLGFSWLFDTVNLQPRYTLGVTFYLHAEDGGS